MVRIILLLAVVVVLGGITFAIVMTVRGAKARAAVARIDRTNTLAILGFVLSLVAGVPAVVVSHLALAQLARTKERGWGLAVAGLWLGYAGIVLVVVGVPFLVIPGR